MLPEEELDLLLKLRSLWRGLVIFSFGLAPEQEGVGAWAEEAVAAVAVVVVEIAEEAQATVGGSVAEGQEGVLDVAVALHAAVVAVEAEVAVEVAAVEAVNAGVAAQAGIEVASTLV